MIKTEFFKRNVSTLKIYDEALMAGVGAFLAQIDQDKDWKKNKNSLDFQETLKEFWENKKPNEANGRSPENRSDDVLLLDGLALRGWLPVRPNPEHWFNLFVTSDRLPAAAWMVNRGLGVIHSMDLLNCHETGIQILATFGKRQDRNFLSEVDFEQIQKDAKELEGLIALQVESGIRWELKNCGASKCIESRLLKHGSPAAWLAFLSTGKIFLKGGAFGHEEREAAPKTLFCWPEIKSFVMNDLLPKNPASITILAVTLQFMKAHAPPKSVVEVRLVDVLKGKFINSKQPSYFHGDVENIAALVEVGVTQGWLSLKEKKPGELMSALASAFGQTLHHDPAFYGLCERLHEYGVDMKAALEAGVDLVKVEEIALRNQTPSIPNTPARLSPMKRPT